MNRRIAFAAAFCAAVLAGCTDGQPIVLSTNRVLSPDGKLEAIVEEVDNGMGFGLGMLLYEVHIQPAGTSVAYHGEESASCAFYVDVGSTSDSFGVEWSAERELTVRYSGSSQSSKHASSVMGVKILYAPASPVAMGHANR